MPRQKLGIETRGLGRSRTDKLEGKILYLCHPTHTHTHTQTLFLWAVEFTSNQSNEYGWWELGRSGTDGWRSSIIALGFIMD